MALAKYNFFSNVLGMHMSCNVLLPQPSVAPDQRNADGNYKILYLLHGMSDDENNWFRMTSIERYARGKSLIVVTPNAHRSFYLNMHDGGRYWEYISEELPQVLSDTFHISNRQEDNFVCGLSMGGFGAFHWALKQPNKFAGACAISPVADIKDFPALLDENRQAEMQRIFGSKEQLANSPDDLFYLVNEYKKAGYDTTKFLQICGTEDFLYSGNIRFKEHCQQANFACEYLEETGDHTWEFWDKHVQTALKFFGL